ncbi:MAG: peptidoglycan D,D-transpeptidase FtsI family protein [Tepidiformaceae bacterium]
MPQQRAPGAVRVWLPAAVLTAFAIAICVQLVRVQVFEHERYAAEARVERRGNATFFARRGSILDRNGSPLATSVDTWDIYVSPRAWKDRERAAQASAALGDILRMDAAAIRATVAGNTGGDQRVAQDVAYETGVALMRAGIAGVVALPNTARTNPEGDLAASVLGLIGQDNTGLAGLEAQYNDVLQGKAGRAIYERDSTGEPIPFGQYIAINPVPGKDVVLTIDRYLQRLAEEQLAEAVKKHRAAGGTIIMIEPQTGDILALATLPGLKYSTLDLSDRAQTDALLRNWAVTDLYEPGSVMKVVTTAAAIDAGLVSPDTSYIDNGIVSIHGTPIRNWDFNVYGPQTMTGVLQNSINTGAVFMAEKLGETRFHQYLDAFGFGRPTGIDLSGEAAGIVRRPWDRDWSPVDLATQSFGQSISVTPLQMIAAVAAAINGGKLVQPRLVKATIAPDGTREDVAPTVSGRAISQETSATMRRMLEAVVNPGWYHPGKPKNYTAGGKSGTANVPVWNGYDDRQVASFIGFTPADQPKVLILVKLDQNRDLLTGTMAAAPVFARLADATLAYMNVRPDAPKLAGVP